jgi:glycosyltransferase involved in cell wall biosynthesis
MRIGIDARWILNPEKNPSIGIGHYTYQLIRHLLEIDKENQYVLFFDYRVRDKDVEKFSKPNVNIKYFPWSDYKKYLPGAYSEILGLATISKNNLDVFHITSPDARVPIGYHGKVICTFQDLAVFKFPKLFPELKKIKAKYNRQAMAKRADKIIAVSESMKKDIEEIFNESDKKISVVKNGLDERFFVDRGMVKEDNWNDKKRKFKIENKYILFIGTLEPIKNITRLLHAFRSFREMLKKEKGSSDYQLVLGGKKGWLGEEYQQIACDLGIDKDVIFTGYVEGDDMRDLLSHCEFFVMPSLYEGFGTTVLEAMASKAPILISDLPTLREIAGKDAVYCNPVDVFDIANKMKYMALQSPDKEEIERNYNKAKNFSWSKCAKETLDIYREFSEEKI